MSSPNKTVMKHSIKLICAGIFAVLGIILLATLFFPKHKDTYRPGTYTTSLTLNDNMIEIEVTVDEETIKSIRMVNLEEDTITMFPLIEPTFEELVSQIYENQSLEGIGYSDESKYTSTVLLEAIKECLAKAEGDAEK